MKRHTSVATIAALLTSAEQEAAALGDEQPGAEHLLLAAARRHGTVALVIDELGIDRDGLAS